MMSDTSYDEDNETLAPSESQSDLLKDLGFILNGQQPGVIEVQGLNNWAGDPITSHTDASEYSDLAAVGVSTQTLQNQLQDEQLNSSIYGSLPEDLIDLLPPFDSISVSSTIEVFTDENNTPACVPLEPGSDEDRDMDLSMSGRHYAEKSVESLMNVAVPPNGTRNRKRLSNSESSATPSTSENDSCNGKRKKKPKMWEKANESNDPKVLRSAYAKSYRDRKKGENEKLKAELADVKQDLDDANERIKVLELENAEKGGIIKELTAKNKDKDEVIADLKESVKEEQEKNSLNPQQTEAILKSIHGVVQAACPSNVTTVNVLVGDGLANKKGAAIDQDKLDAIKSAESLRSLQCTFSIDIDDGNKLTATKH